MVLIRKLIHLEDHLFSASVSDLCFSEGFVTDEPIINAFVFMFTAFLCKLMCRVVLFASGSFSIPVTTWSVFSDVEVRDGE